MNKRLPQTLGIGIPQRTGTTGKRAGETPTVRLHQVPSTIQEKFQRTEKAAVQQSPTPPKQSNEPTTPEFISTEVEAETPAVLQHMPSLFGSRNEAETATLLPIAHTKQPNEEELEFTNDKEPAEDQSPSNQKRKRVQSKPSSKSSRKKAKS